MNDFDVPPFEMDDNSPFDLDDAASNGDCTAGSSAVHEYFGELRQMFETTTDVPVGASLAEFIDVVDLTSTTVADTAPGKKRKMITGISTFIATTTGKIVLGTTVAAASVGGAHAADLVDVPGLPEATVEVVELDETTGSEETIDEVIHVTPADAEDDAEDEADDAVGESDVADENELTGVDEEHDEDGDDEDGDDEDGDDEDGDDEVGDDEDDDKNHGETVSEFAHSTDLEGCERGQAIAELARSNGEQKRQEKADDDDSNVNDESTDVGVNDESADVDVNDESDNKCKDHSDDEDDEDDENDVDDESSDESASEDDADDAGNGHSKGKGKGHEKNKHSADAG